MAREISESSQRKREPQLPFLSFTALLNRTQKSTEALTEKVRGAPSTR